MEATKKTDTGKKRGRLSGIKYNVVPKSQVTVMIRDEDLKVIEKVSKGEEVSRSKLIAIIVENWISHNDVWLKDKGYVEEQ